MIAPLVVRRAPAALLLAALCAAAVVGCGQNPPPANKADEGKKTDPPLSIPNPNDPKPGPKPDVPKPPEGPPKSTLGTIEKAADDFATAFRRDLVEGTAKSEALTTAFRTAVGKPWAFPGDKEAGYSANGVASFLSRTAQGVNFGLELKRPDQAGDVVYLRGALQQPGGYHIRLVKEGGTWKVDWLSVSSVDTASISTTPTVEGTAQAFVVSAFVETLADRGENRKDERHLLLAAAMTKELRAAWAPLVFDQDKQQGYDYGPAKLTTEATKIGGGTTAYVASRVGDLPEFKVELTKPAGKKSYTIKLVKGTGPNDWLVSEVIEAK
jgi:hypothetical protein